MDQMRKIRDRSRKGKKEEPIKSPERWREITEMRRKDFRRKG